MTETLPLNMLRYWTARTGTTKNVLLNRRRVWLRYDDPHLASWAGRTSI